MELRDVWGYFGSMAVAFKEWALVCEALGRGQQSVILRKGGIAEGRGGFGFDHEEFYLFPTWFHGQLGKVRIPNAVLPEQDPGSVTLSQVATLEWTGRISDKEAAHRLEVLHVLDASVIEDACREAIGTATKRYAKRQLTWCRTQFHFPSLDLSALPHPESTLPRALEILVAQAT